MFQYSAVRHKNQPISGHCVIPTVASSVTPADVSENIPAQFDPMKTVTPSGTQKNTIDDPNHFVIVPSEVRIQELKNHIVLKNVASANYGRVIGGDGSNSKRLAQTYGIRLTSKQSTTDGNYEFFISGAEAESRREALDDIIECLPVTMEFVHTKIESVKKSLFKKIGLSNYVQICMPTMPGQKVKICGKLESCKRAYQQLTDLIYCH
jgi:hypothetical protein